MHYSDQSGVSLVGTSQSGAPSGGHYTCVHIETGLFAHVAQADRDAVSSARLQASQQILHRVVLGGQFVVPLHLTDPVSHVDRIRLHPAAETERTETQKN